MENYWGKTYLFKSSDMIKALERIDIQINTQVLCQDLTQMGSISECL